MSGSVHMNVNKMLRFASLGMTIALFVFILIPVGEVMAAPDQPSFDKEFLPSTIGPGSTSTLLFTIINIDPFPITDLAFTDNLPAGMTIATPANAFTDCTDAVLSAPDGGGTVTFSEGRLASNSTCTVIVNVTSNTPGTHMNVSGVLTSSAGNSEPATADLIVATDRPGFTKSFAPNSILVGGRSTLTFTIDNSANQSYLFNLAFFDILPTGMLVADPANVSNTCTDGVVAAEPRTNIISLISGMIDGGEICTISMDVTATGVGVLGNISGELTSVNPSYQTLSSGKASAVLTATQDNLFLMKSFTDDPVPPGGTVTLEFTVGNFDRFDAATNISFSDDLSATLVGLTAISLPANPCGAGSTLTGTGFLTLTGGNLAPGASCTFSVPLQVPAGASSGAYTNTTSSISADVGGSQVIGSPASDVLFVEPAPILTKEFLDAVTLQPDPIVGVGDDVVLRFTIQNTSPTSAAANIAFIDELTTFLPFPVTVILPATPCGASSIIELVNLGTDRQGLSLTNGSLEAAPGAGSSCTFDVTLTLPVDLAGGIYTNTTEDITATVDGETVTGEPATDDFTVVAAPVLTKEFVDDPVDPGGTVTLDFTLSHDVNAPGDASAISFTDDLAATLAGLTATSLPLTDICGPGNGTLTGSAMDTLLTFSSATLAPGEVCTFSVTLEVPGTATAGSHTNTTSNISATVLGTAVTGNPASDDLKIVGLNFTKEFIGDPAIPGETVTLRFTIENESPTEDATGIYFTDNLNMVLSGLVAMAPLPTEPCGTGSLIVGTNNLTFSDGSLDAGTSCTFDVTVQIPIGSVSGIYNNSTSSFYAFMDGSLVFFENATDVLIVSSDWLLLSKSFTDDPVPPGGNITLEFSITNTHTTSNASEIAFTDDLTATLPGLEAVGLPLSDICGAGSQLSGTDFLDFSGGSLGPSNSCTFSVTLLVPANAAFGDYINTTSPATGTIKSLPVKGDPASDDLRISYLSFDKAFVNSALPGGTVILDFNIENPDTVNAADRIGFSDDLDAVIPGLAPLELPVGDICGPGSQLTFTDMLYFSYGSLEPSSSCTFSVTLQIPAGAAPGSYLNKTSDLTVDGFLMSYPAEDALIIDPLVSIDDVAVDEGAGTADFTLSLNGRAVRNVDVDYATSDGTAQAGLDYMADDGTAIISAGELTTTLSITILDDDLYENDETFFVMLSNSTDSEIADSEGIGTIIDDEPIPNISFSLADYIVDEDIGSATITVTLNTVSGLDAMADYASSDGTAVAGDDYSAISGTLTVPAGQTVVTFDVPIFPDSLLEDDETLYLTLGNPVNAMLADPMTATLTIEGDDIFVTYLPLAMNNHSTSLLVYENDFEIGAGNEWSDPIVETAPSGENYLGQFATDVVTLTLTGLPEHSYAMVKFDLYIIRSWDGNDLNFGPDTWNLHLDGTPILHTTFSNWGTPDKYQAYPGTFPGGNYPGRTGAEAINTLGYIFEENPQDATYRLTFVIEHNSDDLNAAFRSAGLQVITDEGWGLDNIEVVLLP